MGKPYWDYRESFPIVAGGGRVGYAGDAAPAIKPAGTRPRFDGKLLGYDQPESVPPLAFELGLKSIKTLLDRMSPEDAKRALATLASANTAIDRRVAQDSADARSRAAAYLRPRRSPEESIQKSGFTGSHSSHFCCPRGLLPKNFGGLEGGFPRLGCERCGRRRGYNPFGKTPPPDGAVRQTSTRRGAAPADRLSMLNASRPMAIFRA